MIDRKTVWLFLCVFCCGGTFPCWAATGGVPVDGSPVIPDRELIHIPLRSARIEEIVAVPDDAWRAVAPDQANLGFVKGEVWVRMRIHNPPPHDAVQRVIEVPFARMDYLDWYVFSQGALVQTACSGSMLQQAEGTLNTRYPALPFAIPPGETVELYVRIVTETVVHVNFQVWDADAYAQMAQHRESHASFRMGALFALIVLSYFFVWGFRDMGAVWFSLTFTCFGIGVANLAGFWPEFSWMSGYFRVKLLLLFCIYGCISCLLMYVRNFYDLNQCRPRLARWLLVVALVFFAVGGASVWLPYRPVLRLGHVGVFVAFLVTFAVSITMHTRQISSWLNLAAHGVFFGYMFTHLAFDLGWIPLALRPEYSGFIALSIAMLLFILAQVYKVRELDAAYEGALKAGQKERERRLEDQRVMLRDLHDGLGGMAATVSMMAAYGKRHADVAVKNERFGAIERMAGYAGAEIRSLMNALEQPAPFWADWLSDLREYAEGVLGASHVELEWECVGCHPEKWTGFAPALSLMRVIKEAIRNVVKHAGATRVRISLVFQEGELEIRVRDNGRGFECASATRGHGLSNMEKRVKELGGRVSMHSTTDGADILFVVRVEQDGA